MRLDDEYYLRSLQESDVEGAYPSWFEDQDVCAFNSHGKFGRTKEYFVDFVKQINSQKMSVWAICHVEDGHIGNIALQNISFINRNAEFAIIIGDQRHWGKGVGKLASAAIIEHGFKRLNLHRIYCGTACTNSAMKKLAVNLGMTEEGIRKEHIFLEGEWVDVIEYGVLRSNFQISCEK
jgi:ribosomal-protein-alanine N-acetyltransferase